MSIIENLIVNNSNESQPAKYIDITYSTKIYVHHRTKLWMLFHFGCNN